MTDAALISTAPAAELAQTLAYVQAAAPLAGLSLAPAQAASVAAHLQRTAALAQLLDQATLPPDAEPAALYCPAPYPVEDAA